MIKRKKAISLLAVTAAVTAVIAGVWAYYSSQSSLDNQLKTNKYGNEVEEQFTPNSNWQPGEEVVKKVGVRNTGNYDLFVRIKMSETWKRNGVEIISHDSAAAAFRSATAANAKQTDLTDGYTTGDQSVVFKKLSASPDWTFNDADGYWYYNKKLAPTLITDNLLESIVLAGDTDMGHYEEVKYYTRATTKPDYTLIGSTDADAADKWVPYTGAMPDKTTFTRVVSKLADGRAGYADADYTLSIKTETLQGTKEAFVGTSSWKNTTPEAIQIKWGVK